MMIWLEAVLIYVAGLAALMALAFGFARFIEWMGK